MPLSLHIITPDGVVWKSDSVKSVTLPARGGEVGILEGHIPLITIIDAGDVRVENTDGSIEDVAVDKGYARCMADKVAILTEAAVKFEDIDLDAIKSAKEKAEAALEKARRESGKADPEEIERLEAIMRFSIAQELAKAKRK